MPLTQVENGVQWAKKLEQMFKDVKMADEDAPNFRQYVSNLEVRKRFAW